MAPASGGLVTQGGVAEWLLVRLRRKCDGSAYGGKTVEVKIMATVYVLYSDKSGKHYVGSSREDSSIRRLESHNKGKVRSTKYGRPWKVVIEERYETYTEARKRELFLKSGQGRKWIAGNCSVEVAGKS